PSIPFLIYPRPSFLLFPLILFPIYASPLSILIISFQSCPTAQPAPSLSTSVREFNPSGRIGIVLVSDATMILARRPLHRDPIRRTEANPTAIAATVHSSVPRDTVMEVPSLTLSSEDPPNPLSHLSLSITANT
ncbi:hypothetical protein PENTCL1PPCAC_17502, partial [Pristionchus entomophagus]